MIKKLTSTPQLIHLLKTSLKKFYFFGNENFCNVCHSKVRYFKPSGFDYPAISNLNIVGGGLYLQDICPVCLSSYRQRSIAKYLIQNDLLLQSHSVLHIAPEQGLYHFVSRKVKGKYVCGDLLPQKYLHIDHIKKIDITDIGFPDNFFNLILCNHVLEHIPNDQKAIAELFRVLAMNGTAILQVPISMLLTQTYEDDSVVTDEQRVARYGQKDHVRVYAMDYIDRLKDGGFVVNVMAVSELIKIDRDLKLHLDEREILFVCTKK